jgi:hypothetical protein
VRNKQLHVAKFYTASQELRNGADRLEGEGESGAAKVGNTVQGATKRIFQIKGQGCKILGATLPGRINFLR